MPSGKRKQCMHPRLKPVIAPSRKKRGAPLEAFSMDSKSIALGNIPVRVQPQTDMLHSCFAMQLEYTEPSEEPHDSAEMCHWFSRSSVRWEASRLLHYQRTVHA